ncbi:hypothetical protein D0T84_16820 [Dysgonomonas sp. 521]|uniref:hypothetical protein n=1 Tax=Dysgonomonas sp. 521 TaxID=2302932 RepID=UPI0013D1F7B4|nr:hypothetical protein [Dysgonomonas sp. 521]NDV96565.1 hypothetical protein [Dysgonomonas sp. 521]
MGYFTEGLEIANDTIQPAKVSLSGNPNYIQFEAKTSSKAKPVDIQLKVTGSGYALVGSQPGGIKEYDNISAFSIIEAESGREHKFRGTSDSGELGKDSENNIFYLGELNQYTGPAWQYQRDKTTQSLKDCLKQNDFLKSFNISISAEDNSVINLTSNGEGKRYAFWFAFEKNSAGKDYIFFNVSGDPTDTYPAGADQIALNYDNVEIHLDLYKNTSVFLGEDDTPDNNNMGTQALTLTKAYSYAPIWFNVNILGNKDTPNAFLDAKDWVETGTIRDFRFTAKRVISNKINSGSSLLYHSPVLYSITGYNRTLEANDLSAYVFDTKEIKKEPGKINKVKPLTNQPAFFHIKGQTQYFNFILSDAGHSQNLAEEYRFGIRYELLSQSGRTTEKVVRHLKARKDFFMVNTLRLDIDSLLDEYPKTGMVKASLIYLYPDCPDKEAVQISEDITFNILPECLHKVNDFAFLNRLGGWSSFNFSGTEQTDFKTETSTIFKTQLPGFTSRSEIESVYSKKVTEQFIVQSMPVTRQVCNWLKELSASKSVYELATKRYIIVDELNIKPNSKDELFRLEMKYRYSDSYN